MSVSCSLLDQHQGCHTIFDEIHMKADPINVFIRSLTCDLDFPDATMGNTYTGSNPATVIPVKTLEGFLVEKGLFIIIISLLLYQLGHLTTLHDFTAASYYHWLYYVGPPSPTACPPLTIVISIKQATPASSSPLPHQRILKERGMTKTKVFY